MHMAVVLRTIDPRMPIVPGRGMSGYHRPGRCGGGRGGGLHGSTRGSDFVFGPSRSAKTIRSSCFGKENDILFVQ